MISYDDEKIEVNIVVCEFCEENLWKYFLFINLYFISEILLEWLSYV